VFGFEIGHFRISLARILVAIGLFASIVFATRLLQRWLQSSVLTPDRMDPGIAHSVHTGIGYAGIALAGLFAVSYAGFDITNLAIVAGALSVGIGFGLQSIVNNFVSGLILLVERPVKVGDWIVVKGQEGYVRRISVRATEIETFDRASLIMPNSELITGSVTNWTHRNAMGRITINVGASYRSDPEQVIKILTDIAANCPLILQHPKPLVIFEDLGASALEFSLRAVVPDINSGLEARNSLRIAIRHPRSDRDHARSRTSAFMAPTAPPPPGDAFQARKHERMNRHPWPAPRIRHRNRHSMRRLWLPEISISAPLPANDASRSETASKAICDAVCTPVIGDYVAGRNPCQHWRCAISIRHRPAACLTNPIDVRLNE
jgi:small-conductance mechanosensitive channel